MEQEFQEEQRSGNIILDINARLREVEGKYNMLRDRALIINQNMIQQYKKTHSEINQINSDIKEIKIDLFRIKEAMRHLIKEMEYFAKKEDVRVLEKYITFWNPMKLTTEADVIKILEKRKIKDGS